MRLTSAHVQAFAYSKLSPHLRLLTNWRAPSIDERVNAHAGRPSKVELERHNILTLLRGRLRLGDDALTALKPSDWDRSNFPRRYFAFARWRSRIVSQRLEREWAAALGPRGWRRF